MKKRIIITGYLFILAALSFWISWLLMPDPGTTDTKHILSIVKASRMPVLYSVVIQISSSVLYLVALFLLVKISYPATKTLAGIVLLGIGAMGLCADAFFHLLAWFMTDNSVNIQEDVVRVMEFMQTKGVAFLLPILIPFFIGSLVLTTGLNQQAIISTRPKFIVIAAFVIGILSILISKILGYSIPGITITVLGVFAAAQAFIGFELIQSFKKEKREINIEG